MTGTATLAAPPRTLLHGLAAAASVAVAGLGLTALATQPIAAWTSAALMIFIVLLLICAVWLWKQPNNVFAVIAALFNALVVGRLFSTLHLVTSGPAVTSNLDPLMIAETGPGISSVTWASVALFLALVALLFQQAWRHTRASTVDGVSVEQWGLAALRIYVGLMFIAHFAGHLFGGPAAFKVFVDYFGSIGLPEPAAFVILAGVIEFAVTIGLAFGWLTRLAALVATAYLFVAVGLGGHYAIGYVWVLPSGGWEFPALWMFATAIFMFTGGGPLSLDAWMHGRRIGSSLRRADDQHLTRE